MINELFNTSVEEVEEVVVEDDSGTGEKAQLIVYNDDHNTFDWVIQCFMDVLGHSSEQSEQLALIIHFKGKATVKTAPKDVLKPKKDALIDRGLSAVIEEGG
ncbi:MAG: ATP-dependent Clp protease adaptor ClpS [Phaeodactylibacter xiamenensis]|uniref:Clp protease ClpS n=1 Tax=Phaeodactylibacter xiamenensis TaxID=1524460 RepID=A0A098S9J7_9BACT|nr:ATP-dependent Clp protease adaptor ClpS [Phaeodactylibacter xiamenensis]KGE89254.1 Clp protease ClpS [Phaeodactylibacter xiamenensis]MCR9051362.1 ATP-dependent Clp protease adaptor ClpS [bacterium]